MTASRGVTIMKNVTSGLALIRPPHPDDRPSSESRGLADWPKQLCQATAREQADQRQRGRGEALVHGDDDVHRGQKHDDDQKTGAEGARVSGRAERAPPATSASSNSASSAPQIR